ncbi:hypothetical protein [uncultured Bacteroides sp.]|uniref:hypothetical protein n=1 Tax=uncultured Bacteroides sp. TaxID=162156 RepID=UPI00261FE642|nr:hypothetical protein [uncultured Bacteroides sp.]
MRERFKLPFSQEDAHKFLLQAIQSEVQYRGKDFVMTRELYALTYNLAKWLTEDSHYFGYMMCGLCGNGKTTVVKALRTLLDKINIRDDYNKQWELRMFDAKALCRMAITDEDRFNSLCYERMLAIDDLGCEPLEVQCYGNIYTPVIDLLTRRYDRQLFTIVTTNLTPQEIRPRYGDRIADRFNEMMRCIIFKNDSFRIPDKSADSLSDDSVPQL